MSFPREFTDYHDKILGNESTQFLRYLETPRGRLSIRVNTLKTQKRQVKRILSEANIEYGQIPWCEDGLWVTNTELDLAEHQMGLYYIQSASSMIAPQILGPAERVLDLCAAPGGKTTYLAQLMKNRGTLISNDQTHSRLSSLVYNIQRIGATNTAVTNQDAVGYGKKIAPFDRVLVDAPCSGVGTLKQSRQILSKWSLEWVNKLSELQKKMIESAYDILVPGGALVYTTCTTTLEENENVIGHLLGARKTARLDTVKLEGMHFSPALKDELLGCARIDPTEHDTEPHFIARVTKDE